jgi:hypothetical protein
MVVSRHRARSYRACPGGSPTPTAPDASFGRDAPSHRNPANFRRPNPKYNLASISPYPHGSKRVAGPSQRVMASGRNAAQYRNQSWNLECRKRLRFRASMTMSFRLRGYNGFYEVLESPGLPDPHRMPSISSSTPRLRGYSCIVARLHQARPSRPSCAHVPTPQARRPSRLRGLHDHHRINLAVYTDTRSLSKACKRNEAG